jgi:hypothetical protein
MCILHEDVGHLDLFMYVKRSGPLESAVIYVPLPSRAYKIRDKQYMWDQTDTFITHCLRHHMIP